MNTSYTSAVVIKTAMDICTQNCTRLTKISERVTLKDTSSLLDIIFSVYLMLYRYLVPITIPILLVLCICKLWEMYIISTKDHTCNSPLPDGKFGLPFVGETLEFIFKGRKFYDYRREKYGKIYKTHLLGRPTIRIIGVKIARQILSHENTLVTSQWPMSTQMLLGKGSLSISTGKEHAFRKKVIMQAFTNSALSSYTSVIDEVVMDYIGKWCKERHILGYPELKSLTFELSCRVLLGIKMNRLEKERLMAAFEKFLRNLFSLPIYIPGSGLYKGMKARKTLLEKIEQCIKEKQHNGASDGFVDALSLMTNIEGNGKVSLEELKELGLELLFAGHETTSSAACTLMLQLTKHPEIAVRLTEELARNGMTGYGQTNIDFEKLSKLKYLRNVVKEVLRITPPIGGGFRKALQTFEVNGFQIPKGWTILYAIRDSHETDDEIGSPEVFNPDRWNDLNGNERNHFIPFGSGKKGCAGKELAILILKILAIELCRSCSWRALNENPRLKYLPVPHPVDDLPVEFMEMYDFRPRSLTA